MDAKKRGKRIHIVHYDWFEFSVVLEERQPEREYSMRDKKAKENAIKREKDKMERGKREAIKSVDSSKS